jgi:hypothetical protein
MNTALKPLFLLVLFIGSAAAAPALPIAPTSSVRTGLPLPAWAEAFGLKCRPMIIDRQLQFSQVVEMLKNQLNLPQGQ